MLTIDLIYSIDNATEAIEFTNNNVAQTAVILIAAFSGFLGLCIVVCIAGVFMKKKCTYTCTSKRMIISSKFTPAGFNPTFHRYVIIIK